METRQVIVIGGGEVWQTHEEYIAYLRAYEFSDEKFEKFRSQRWKERLQSDLGDEYDVVRIDMPCAKNAKYDEWSIWFTKVVPFLRDGCIVIGHSLGANFLAKYLSQNAIEKRMAQLHLVAGCFGAVGGFDIPDDLNGVEEQCDNVWIYHSQDDPVVSIDDAKKYMDALPEAKTMIFSDRGHFVCEEFPELVDNIRHAS
jgi:predicted alpha/beta hydrolase family esterase